MKQKLTLVLIALFTTMGAWATTDIVFSSDEIKRDGSNPAIYYDGSGNVVASSAWCRSFKTNTSIPITFTVGSLNRFSNYSGGFNTSGNLTFTATVPSQYIIKSVSFKAKIIDGGSKETYIGSNTAGKVTLTSEYQTVSSAALSSSSVTFRFEKGNDGSNSGECIVVFEDFTFTIDTELADAAASISNNHFYRIVTKNNGTSEGETKYYLTSTGTLTTDVASAAHFCFTATTEAQFTPAGFAWRITPDKGTTHFTNPTEGSRNQFIHYTTSNNRQTWEAQVFYWNGSKYAVRATNYNGSGYDCNAFWTVTDYDSNGTPEADYASTLDERHYVWQIEELQNVTYNLIYNEKTLASTIVDGSTVIGTAALPLSSWNIPYCTYTYSPTTITAETETVNVTMTWDGPFAFSSDFASATWYNMSLRNKWAAYSESGAPYPLYSTKSDATSQTRESMWAFIGDPYNGVRIINRKAGSGKYLGCNVTINAHVGDAEFGTYTDAYTLWAIGTNNNGFTLHSYNNRYLYDASNQSKLRIYEGSGAGGASETGASLVVATPTYCDLALAYLDEFAESHAVGEYFGLKESAVSGLRTSIATAGDGITESVYTSTIIPAIEALWPGTDNANVTFPDDGYYYIKSVGARANGPGYVSYTSDGLVTRTTPDLNSIIYLTKESSIYKMSVQGLNLQQFTSWSQQAQVNSLEGSDVTLRMDSPGVGIIENTSSASSYVEYTKYFHESSSYQVVSWLSSSTESHWTIEDVTPITISLNDGGDGNHYATLCVPFSYTVSDATAYTLEKSDNVLTPTEVDGAVPAGTPVLLQGTSATATLTISGTDYAATPLITTALTGTYLAKTISGENDYVLGTDGTKVGFYHWNSNNLGANRAYIVGSGSGVKGYVLSFDDDATAIEMVNGQSSMVNGQPIYNLAGQRISKMQKGINIVNGKKIMVK